MKILILSVSAGGGHAKAAESLKQYIKLNNANSDIKIVDTLKYINPLIDKVVIGSYLKTIKVSPALFGKMYSNTEDDDGLTSFITSNFNKMMTLKLFPFIKEYNPDVIVSTHPFPAEMVSIMKEKGKFNIPCVTILTDYGSHGTWIQKNTDRYIVSNSDMIEEMVDKGADSRKIFDYGIPVKPEFFKKFNRKETLKSLDLDPNKITLLMMGGSLGIGKISSIYKKLMNLEDDIQIIVITGNNKKLYSELDKLKTSAKNKTKVIGFTNKVNKYMQCADVLLTKPGGLTITEALICNLPMAIFSPIPGQEEKNARFLLKNNLAININSIDNAPDEIHKLLSSENKLKSMKHNCSIFSKPNCGNDIYNLLNSLIESKKSSGYNNNIYFDDNPKDTNTFFKSIEQHFLKTAQKFLL
ncbi:MGDG synthase family glycosyltransferase [Clostridium oceanicum]|uniref:Glycosyltransferase n=1 Tax=Clostridium oceanicum TaxID=1543 RepID=A0ABN1JPN7_9CLOT